MGGILRTSEFWTAILGLIGLFARPALHLTDATWNAIAVFVVGYIVARISGKVARGMIDARRGL